MAKFKKEKGKKSKDADFKKKVKVGRTIKKANETLPKVKVAKILIRNQFVEKINKKFIEDTVKTNIPNSQSDIDAVAPTNYSLLKIKKKIVSELKQCFPNVKPADKKGFLVTVKEALVETHCDLSQLVINVVVEKICCPLMYDQSDEVRAEVACLLRCVIVRYIKASKFKGGFFPATTQSCPLLPASVCRALNNPSFCMDALKVLDLMCDLCPLLVQSASVKILESLFTLLYKQTYFQLEICPGGMKLKNQFLDVDRFAPRSDKVIVNTWTLPRVILTTSPSLLTRESRVAVLRQIIKVFTVLSNPSQDIRCEYLAFADNIMDDEKKCWEYGKICFRILCAAWRDLCETGGNVTDNVLIFPDASFSLACLILKCMKMSLELPLCNFPLQNMFTKWTQSELSHVLEDTLLNEYPYTVFKKSNKKGLGSKEMNVSTSINTIVADIKDLFFPPT